MIKFNVQTRSRDDFVDITNEVINAASSLGVTTGTVMVCVPHTTAAVTINEGADPDVVRDMIKIFDKLVPWQDGYHHAEGNSAAHLKTSMVGSSVLIAFVDGKPQLGTWQTIWFCDFDGPRNRTVQITKL